MDSHLLETRQPVSMYCRRRKWRRRQEPVIGLGELVDKVDFGDFPTALVAQDSEMIIQEMKTSLFVDGFPLLL